FLAWDILYLEHRMRRLERRMERKNWRELHDPFDLRNIEFLKLYRLSPEIVIDLIETLRPRLEHERPGGLSPERQVLATLRFYAVGCFQSAIGEQWDIAISQPSVCRCIRKVTDAINDLRQWVRFPTTDGERQVARE
ncbi:Putative nuclease HARBI1, partial [Harpegnathos saltator]